MVTPVFPKFGAGARVGNYEIEREVATGSYAAIHVVLPRRAIIKVMQGNLPAFAVKLMREACILEALQHPGIVKVFESGVLPDRRPWFALELVDGDELTEVLELGSLRAVEVVQLVVSLAEILEHAHRRGVIHRGLRPDRIVVTGRTLCITDWSDARTHDASSQIPNLPAPGARAYIAPEVTRGDPIDDRADVFALGVIAYQALTGVLPSATAYVPAAQQCKNAPAELTTLIDSMLAHDRFDRPSAAEVRSELFWLGGVLEASVSAPEHVVLVDTEGVPATAAMPRIRKPRWTPPISYLASDLADLVSGEIELES